MFVIKFIIFVLYDYILKVILFVYGKFIYWYLILTINTHKHMLIRFKFIRSVYAFANLKFLTIYYYYYYLVRLNSTQLIHIHALLFVIEKHFAALISFTIYTRNLVAFALTVTLE